MVEVEPERFEEMVADALDGLPEELGRLMSNVAVTVEHRPGPPGLLGLYEGVPLTSRTTGYAGVLPDRITIYRVAICASCRTTQEVSDQVRKTVIHEVAHHFGIDDERLSELGWLDGHRAASWSLAGPVRQRIRGAVKVRYNRFVSDLPLSPEQAWARLEAGNRHWAAGHLEHPDQDTDRRLRVAAGQDPFATIVSCIDSRVPPETVFDQGIGDLFAVRTGAQTIDGLVTASIEYGPLENGTPLIVVLGHARCGAVTAAVRAIQSGEHLPGHLDAIVDRLRPAYLQVASQVDSATGDLIDQVVRAQIHRTVSSLASDGPLAALVNRGDLGIVGAHYDLDTGLVTRLHALGL